MFWCIYTVCLGWSVPIPRVNIFDGVLRLVICYYLTGDCLAHKTGVASGALVIFLRFLCEPDAAFLFFNRKHELKPSVDLRSVSIQTQSGQRKVTITNNSTALHIDNLMENSVHIANNKTESDAVEKFKRKQSKTDNGNVLNKNERKLVSSQENVIHMNQNKQNFQQDSDITSNQNLLNANQNLQQLGNLDSKVDTVRLLHLNDQPSNLLLDRVVRQNNPLEMKKLVADGRYIRESSNFVGMPVQQAESNQHIENDGDGIKAEHLPDQEKQPVVLDIPDEDIGDKGDDDENDDYDDDGGDDDGYDDEDENYQEEHDNQPQLPKDPDNVGDDKGDNDEDDDDYNNEDYDDEKEYDADYDKDLKSAKEDSVIKSVDAAANKDVLKGHINARNIVHRNDFQSDHDDYGDNKRYDDKNVKHVNHDRYAYDDYKNDNDDEDDEDENEDDYDYDDKNEDVEIKDSNADIKLNTVKHLKPKPTSDGALQSNLNISNHTTVSSKSAIFVFAIPFVLIVLLMYRFIKKRRIHFRYKPRISFKV